jgi:hypothetical protein
MMHLDGLDWSYLSLSLRTPRRMIQRAFRWAFQWGCNSRLRTMSCGR